jgi:hypothetical protein
MADRLPFHSKDRLLNDFAKFLKANALCWQVSFEKPCFARNRFFVFSVPSMGGNSRV